MSDPDKTRELAAFAAHAAAADLPAEVKRKLLINTADTLGVAFGAGSLDHVRNVVAVVRLSEVAAGSSVFTGGFKTSASEAAFANGVMAHACDFDDAHKFVHPGCVVVPAVFALGEAQGASGAEIVAALAAGYEVVVRVGLAAGREHRKRGFHPTGTCGVFGAAAGAGRLLGFAAEQMERAFGVAASLSSGITRYRLDGSANKHLHAGAAARNGVLAALLVSEGFRGATSVLDGQLGFLDVYAGGGDPDQLTAGLGRDFRLMESDIKPYPSCRQSHGAIDLALSVARDEKPEPEAIRKIILSMYTYACQPWYATNDLPTTSLEAMLRIPYCVAASLRFGKMDLKAFSDEARADAVLAGLLPKIAVKADEALDANWPDQRPVRLDVELAGGETIRRELRNPSGSKDNPLSEAFIREKFAASIRGRVAPSAADEAFRMILDLEKAPNLDSVMNVFASGDSPPSPERRRTSSLE